MTTTPEPEPGGDPTQDQIDEPHSDAAQTRANDLPAGVSETAAEEEAVRDERS